MNVWVKKRLGEVCTLQRGFDLPTRQRQQGNYPLVSSSGCTDSQAEAKVSRPGVVTGRSGSIGSVFFVDKDFWPLNTTLYVKDFHGNEPRFIFYLLRNFDLKRFASGAGVPTLNRNSVHSELVYIPSKVSEQKQIVTILDEAFEGIDRAIANTEKNLANARELFESYLNTIFTQKGDGWEEKKLGDVCEKVEYGSSAKSLVEGEIPVLRMGNIQNGGIDWTNLLYTSDKEEIKKYLLKYNDVLFNRTNSDEHVGKTAIYKSEMPAIFAGYLIRIHRKEELIDADFLHFYLNSYTAREYGKSIMSRSVNQANINGTKLKGYPISLPSLSIQKQIVENLSFLRKETQRLEAIYRQKLVSLNELKQSILQKAFTGELTADTANQTTKAAQEVNAA